jgi:hypothetical protein
MKASEGAYKVPQPSVTPDKYKKVGDVHARTCICGREDCLDKVRRWHAVSQHDKQHACFVGYQYLPPTETKRDTERTKINKEHRRMCFEHIGVKDLDSRQKSYIANHHFRRELLQHDANRKANDKWVIEKIIPKSKHPFLKVIGKKELYNNGGDASKYAFCVPSYNWNEMLSDLSREESVKVRATNPVPLVSSVTPSAVSASGKRSRPTPKEQNRVQLERKMRTMPEQLAIEHQQMQEQLESLRLENMNLKEENKQLKVELSRKEVALQVALKHNELLQQSGLSRSNIISSEWHKNNKYASRYLFGLGQNWDEYTEYILAFFHDFGVREVEGGSGPFTNFEKVMMVSMKVKRNFEDTTIGMIFGCTKQRVGQVIDEWAPHFGFVGDALTDLDMNLAHDYVSFAECQSRGIPHYKTRHAA